MFTWSAHQYQIELGVWPNRNPGHGISGSSASFNITSHFSLGSWQVVLGTVTLGVASGYFFHKPSKPPTSSKPRCSKDKFTMFYISKCKTTIYSLIAVNTTPPVIMRKAWRVSVYMTAVSPPAMQQQDSCFSVESYPSLLINGFLFKEVVTLLLICQGNMELFDVAELFSQTYNMARSSQLMRCNLLSFLEILSLSPFRWENFCARSIKWTRVMTNNTLTQCNEHEYL